jgi:hypothetical protein
MPGTMVEHLRLLPLPRNEKPRARFFDATGARLRRLAMTPARLKAAMPQAG